MHVDASPIRVRSSPAVNLIAICYKLYNTGSHQTAAPPRDASLSASRSDRVAIISFSARFNLRPDRFGGRALQRAIASSTRLFALRSYGTLGLPVVFQHPLQPMSGNPRGAAKRAATSIISTSPSAGKAPHGCCARLQIYGNSRITKTASWYVFAYEQSVCPQHCAVVRSVLLRS